MKQLSVYLSFPGNCEEAINFYKDCLSGEIVSLQRFGDTPVDSPEEHKQKVMHAEFRAGDIFFMASDGRPDEALTPGDMIHLSINLTDAAEQEAIFSKLSAGGRVDMPLEDTFWGARFGMLTDKYGIRWMLNRELGG